MSSGSSVGFDPRLGENLFKRKLGSIAHSLSLSRFHRPDMTEILLKTRKIAGHPFIHPKTGAIIIQERHLLTLTALKTKINAMGDGPRPVMLVF